MVMSNGSVHPPRRSSLSGAVGANWLGYLVFLVSGFVLPRLIGDLAGQELLGIWDFAWSTINFTNWLQFGIFSAVGRDVARFRVAEDWTSVSRSLSASLVMLLLAFGGGLILISALVYATPLLLPAATDPQVVRETRWVVGILGVNAAVGLPLGVFTGVLVGLERWDLKNLTRSVPELACLAAMAMLLLGGHGLVALAWATLAAEITADLWAFWCVRRLCPELRIARRLVTWEALSDVLSFGGRSYLHGIARGGLYHVNSLIVTACMGPAAVAVFGRQRSLVVSFQKLIRQYGNVFTPPSAALLASGDRDGLRELALRSGLYGMYLALPIVVVLTLAGGPLVRLWMGSAYEAPMVLAVLALGHACSFAHHGTYSILVGMNRHGWVAVAEICCAVLATVAAYVLVGHLHWGLLGAAVAIAVALTLGAGVVPIVLLCRALRIPLAGFLWKTTRGPLLSVLPLAASLLAAQAALGRGTTASLAAGLGAGGTLLAAIYWRWVLPAPLKRRLLKKLGLAGPAKPQTSVRTVEGLGVHT